MDSKIWLYQTNRALNEEEQKALLQDLNNFSEQWQAHGKNLESKFWFHNPFLLVCEVDEKNWSASGCSIDSKVHFLKKIGEQFNVDFFTRMKTIVLDEKGAYNQCNFEEVDLEHPGIKIFNPTVLSSAQMEYLFTSPKDSPMKRLFTYSSSSQR